jgi:hypothetical protein
VWSGSNRRLERLARWQRYGLAADRRLNLWQIPRYAFEVFGQIAACLSDIGQRTARTRRARGPLGGSGTLCGAGSLRPLGATRGCSCTVGSRAGLTGSRNE